MKISTLLPLMIGVVLVQFAWASHWVVAGIYPNIVLVVLVVVTLLANPKAGLIGALVAGLVMIFISPFPLGGQAIALLAAVAVIGFLADYVFTAATPLAVLVQAVVASLVFGLVGLGGTHLIFLIQGMNTEQLWSVELAHTLGQSIYHLILIFILYNIVVYVQGWWPRMFRGWRWRKRIAT